MGCGASKSVEIHPSLQPCQPQTQPGNVKPQSATVNPQPVTVKPQPKPQHQPQQREDDDKIFEDTDFPARVESITTDVDHKNYEKFKDAIWRRPHEIMDCSYDEIKVFDTIDVNDISQGELGNCYFLASISGLAETPERIKSIFQSQVANKNGKYSMRFFVQGAPVIVTVDDRFPCSKESPHRPLFGKPNGKELWSILIEKAWAKLFKGYTKIVAGAASEALENLTGAPSFFFDVDKQSDDEIWENLQLADRKKYVIGAGSRDDVNQEETGIVSGHAYTVISVHEVEGHKLIRLRNPWGELEWKGDFSDSSALWTDSLKKALEYEDSDNGMFYMALKDFRSYYDGYTLHHFSDSWHYSFVEQKSDPKHSSYYKFSVDEPCRAYFRIHQKDKRFLPKKDQESFEYSPANFMIMKAEKDGTYRLLCSSEDEADANLKFGKRTIFMTKDGTTVLGEAGDYIIRAQVQWRHGHEDTCTISAYCSEATSLEKIAPIEDYQSQYCRALAAGDENPTVLKEKIEYVEGAFQDYKYMMFKNLGEEEFEMELEFKELENVELLEQSENKVSWTISPGCYQIALLKIVDVSQPSSYSRSISYY